MNNYVYFTISVKYNDLILFHTTVKIKAMIFFIIDQCDSSLTSMDSTTIKAVSERQVNTTIKEEILEELDVKEEADEDLHGFEQKIEFKNKFRNFSTLSPVKTESIKDEFDIKKEIQDADSSDSSISSPPQDEQIHPSNSIEDRHNNRFICIFCNKAHNYLSRLKKHMRTHSGEKPYACEICCKNFRCKGTLKVHFLTHTGCKPFKCQICEKEFQTSSNLKKHELIHSDEKPHTCDICQRKYRCKTQMKNHRMQHFGEKKYSCNFCNEKFGYLVSLKGHLLKHTGELPPFKCNICDKSFRMSHHLKRHKETHVGAPFVCKKCNRQFLQLRELQKHSSDCRDNFFHRCGDR